jgi:hypothetical protein
MGIAQSESATTDGLNASDLVLHGVTINKVINPTASAKLATTPDYTSNAFFQHNK